MNDHEKLDVVRSILDHPLFDVPYTMQLIKRVLEEDK
jgi:hypothetical protein